MTDNKHLQQTLSTLRSEIGALDSGDAATRRRLGALVEDIETMLGNPAAARADENLGERVKASVLQFEVSHPRIAVVMNELMQQLSNMGI